MSAPLIYLVLGPAGSGRRAILADLVENGLAEGERALLLTAETESPASAEVTGRLDRLTNLARATWSLVDGALQVAAPAPEVSHLFLLADGRGDPVDMVEAVRVWLATRDWRIARVITVIDCGLGHAHPELQRWHEACVHFSDVVLLNHRSGVPNAWVGDFTARLRKQHFPCLVELVKQDEVENPALILDPQARRMSTVFDDDEEWPEIDDEEEIDPADLDAIGTTDPYLARLASGRRATELPDVGRFLDK